MAQALTLSRPLDGVAKLWREYPREAVGFGLLAIAAAAAIGGAAHSTPELPGSAKPAEVAPPAPPPMLVRDVAPSQALEINQEIPVANGPNPAASPFVFKGDKGARAQALQCLASAVYYEAGSQDDDGERAVAQVVLNRVRHPAFPGTVCGVVYQGSTRPTGCQFTFTCDGSLNRSPDADGWRRANEIAAAALSGAVYAPVGWATHYHADYVVPYWASTMAKNDVVGAHLFYRWPGGWGQPSAFSQAYGGREPSAAGLRAAALAAVHVIAKQPGSLAAAIDKIPGAEPLKLSPSMRGDQRVAVRFNLVARKASADVKAQDYSEKYKASDNLKWSLSSDTVADNQKPLGKAATSSASGAN